MKNIALLAFEKAKDAGEAGWHTVLSIYVPYLCVLGKYNERPSVIREECLALAAQRKLKVRFTSHKNIESLEFKLA